MPLLAPQLLAFWLLYPSCFDVNLNCVVIGLELCVKEQLVAAWAKAQLEALYTPLAWQELFFRLLPDLSKSWLQLACILGIDSSALHHCWIVATWIVLGVHVVVITLLLLLVWLHIWVFVDIESWIMRRHVYCSNGYCIGYCKLPPKLGLCEHGRWGSNGDYTRMFLPVISLEWLVDFVCES